MKLILPPKLVEKTSLGPNLVPTSYAFDSLLCRNWPFSSPNRLTSRIIFIKLVLLQVPTKQVPVRGRYCPHVIQAGMVRSLVTASVPVYITMVPTWYPRNTSSNFEPMISVWPNAKNHHQAKCWDFLFIIILGFTNIPWVLNRLCM
jgi:hypothetical protein